MKRNFSDGHVLPRPVELLPEYAHAKARQTLGEKLIEAFKRYHPVSSVKVPE